MLRHAHSNNATQAATHRVMTSSLTVVVPEGHGQEYRCWRRGLATDAASNGMAR
ncbi:hypothetical protein XMIN_3901 [Xanthomonas citri pv. mangiferaeindicae LMG 941]|nr:hypothetical protein XMIN_3901 [Xanthomonas citri pv. mangiferaeindicae LMG 941]